MPRWQFGPLFAGWGGLARFWALIGVLLVLCGMTLQLFGPPREQPPSPVVAALTPPASQPPPQPAKPPAQAVVQAPPAQRPGRDTPGPVADPEPALLEPLPGSTTDLLPRIASDGRMPMQVYAAGFDSSSRRPRVGLLLAGIGLNQADSETAIRSLPGGITLAISPYALNPAKLLAEARLAEHEFLLSIPMEPQGFSLNDPGQQALMTNLSLELNRVRLEWALSRAQGYAGVTSALGGGLLGERFASLPDELQPILAELAHRGLLYVDPRSDAPSLPSVWSRRVDLIVDEPATAVGIDDKLAQLSRLAHAKGSVLGLATAPRPVTIQRIAAWADGLTANGLMLAPASALVQPPAKGTEP
jgi:uncharacterized protein